MIDGDDQRRVVLAAPPCAPANRGAATPKRRASASSSQSRVAFSLAHGVGWSDIKSSVKRLTADRTLAWALASDDSIVSTIIVSSTRC